jgi:two-component system, NtrC family, sensor kinase
LFDFLPQFERAVLVAKRRRAGLKARAATKAAKPALDLRKENAALKRELAHALKQQSATARELQVSLEYQTAISNVLKVISRSAFDLQPVLDSVCRTAQQLCGAELAGIAVRKGERYRYVATSTVNSEWDRRLRETEFTAGRGSVAGRVALDRRVVHIADLVADTEYRHPEFAPIGGARTALGVPLLREGTLLGVIFLGRNRVRPFTARQIDLVRTFADQAVIAIENARLFEQTKEALRKLEVRSSELAESLQHQTATSQILSVISSSKADIQPVFDAIVDSAARLFEPCGATITSLRDGRLHWNANAATLPDFDIERARAIYPIPFDPERSPSARALLERRIVEIPDIAAPDTPEFTRKAAAAGGFQSATFVPLIKQDKGIGTIILTHLRAGFKLSEKQLALVRTFADQVVIAIENARLFDEVQTKTRDLEESLQQQTATADVLKVISRSAFNLDAVLGTLVESAARLCEAERGILFLRKGNECHVANVYGFSAELEAFARAHPIPIDGASSTARAAASGIAVQTVDLLADPGLGEVARQYQKLGGHRTNLGVPLNRDGETIGVFTLTRQVVRAFTDKQIELVQTFADQAVIAIENARLFNEVQQRTHDLSESLQQQTATADVLKIISRSSIDLDMVLNTLVETVARLCRADQAYMWRRRDEVYQLLASCGLSEDAKTYFLGHPPKPGRGTVSGRVALEGRSVHIPDVLKDPEYTYTEAQKIAGFRTVLGVPLLREQNLLGIFSLNRNDADPFTAKEIELASTFADQAVIAIENARLFEELRERTGDLEESLKYQTATSDVLKVINRSTLDLQRVLDTLIQTAAELCDTSTAAVAIRHNDIYRYVATARCTPEYDQVLRSRSLVPGRDSIVSRVLLERKVVHIVDAETEAGYDFPEAINIGRVRSLLGVPMFRDDEVVGVIGLSRQRVEPFTERQIELMRTFAAQAVIAMENARLLGELRERTTDLARSVDELTATGDVLKIISRSSVDLETVLNTLVETVARLCRADHTVMLRRRDDLYHLFASHGISAEARNFFLAHPFAPSRETITGRTALERRAIHIEDVLQDPEYTYRSPAFTGARSSLGIPLLRGDTLIGVFVAARTQVDPFTAKEIELATTFADQAVIAIENARLFDELRERQAELRVTFDNMGDGVVMFDAQARLTAWNRNFRDILDLPDAFLDERPSFTDYFHYLAERGEYSANVEAELSRTIEDTSREMRFERTRPDGRVIEVRRNPVAGGGFVLIYADITDRKRAEAAIGAARDAAEAALRELQATQASLVHAQKMAALGQLTAGIAHEIKNPLNFVNNFAGLSVELLEELKEAAGEAIGTLGAGKRTEILETIGMLTSNLEKIAEHGRRADGIVRGMLQHSRGSSGDWQVTDLNALVEESLNLAYHGARAQNQDFKVALELDLDRKLAPIEIVSQDVSRVLLNLMSNGFYAITKRGLEDDGAFRPLLRIATRRFGEGVEIRVRDNGVGIPLEFREKLFQPFFTTKPTGEGTGLGLSISYEIVAQQHGGTITVDSEVGGFTEFTVWLPRRRRAVAG